MKPTVFPALLALAALAACGSSYSPNSAPPPPPAPGSTTVQLLSSGGNRFSQAVLTVASGTTVRFEWVGGTHNVTSNGSPSFSSSGAPTAAPHTYDVTFTTPGSYNYFCSVHGTATTGMRGTIVVQ
ncbi:MAG: plastocyanin/azurin family copper-binding protein [Gemmatimonadales bacterium]